MEIYELFIGVACTKKISILLFLIFDYKVGLASNDVKSDAIRAMESTYSRGLFDNLELYNLHTY